ncbi:hypothetical protein EGT74_03210 [Chitinophaga lutea]|uniref:Phytanoyl-CoA dioxygenase n=1 Tax=Chitinophaga lutea TaxID=2488634 RepID=A0A3N4PUV9_9BACT|nr:hypothetical protein EGT74_03210 [Chitinophaga lutea]
MEHGFAGEQVGASQHYADLALKTMRLLHVELKVGDSLIFHPNLLHRSGANLSEHQRVPPERAASRNRATLF